MACIGPLPLSPDPMDEIDRRIINDLQGGFPLSERPYADAADSLGIGENELIGRLQAMLDQGVLSRFGPMFNADRMGGAFTLAAMQVPKERFETVAAQVNAWPEVAHNYEREHALNMWFVIGVGRPERIVAVIRGIEAETGLRVFDMPKLEEFFVDLRFVA